MEIKEYIDRNGLIDYDFFIKRYIDKKITEAIAIYKAEDNIDIEEYIPVEQNSVDEL